MLDSPKTLIVSVLYTIINFNFICSQNVHNAITYASCKWKLDEPYNSS